MKNLNDLIDQWIGEEEKLPHPSDTGNEDLWFENEEALIRNKLRQDLKSRKQELVEGIVNTIIAELEKCKDYENIWDYIYALKK